MLQTILPGTWRIQGAHPDMQLRFHHNGSWSLGGGNATEMGGTWCTTPEGVDLLVTRMGSRAGRGLLIAGGVALVSLSLGTAALIVRGVIAGVAASNAARGQNPGVLGVFFRSDVRGGKATAHYRHMYSIGNDQVVLQNTYPTNIVNLTLDRVR